MQARLKQGWSVLRGRSVCGCKEGRLLSMRWLTVGPEQLRTFGLGPSPALLGRVETHDSYYIGLTDHWAGRTVPGVSVRGGAGLTCVAAKP